MLETIYQFFCNLDAMAIPMVKGSIMTLTAVAGIIAWAAKKTTTKKDDWLASLPDDLRELLMRTFGQK